MDKIIRIDGRDVGFRATALTPRLYRHKIGRDIVQDMTRLEAAFRKAAAAAEQKAPLEEGQEAHDQAVREAQMSAMDLEIFENVSFIMARQYDPTLPATVEEWLDGFQTFSIYEILPAICELWEENSATTAKPKKK